MSHFKNGHLRYPMSLCWVSILREKNQCIMRINVTKRQTHTVYKAYQGLDKNYKQANCGIKNQFQRQIFFDNRTEQSSWGRHSNHFLIFFKYNFFILQSLVLIFEIVLFSSRWG